MLSWASRRWHVPLAGDHNGSPRQSLPGWSVFPHNSFPHRLPIQATKGIVHYQNISPEHKQQWKHLSRHPQKSVVPSIDHLKSAIIDLLPVVWPEPGGPAGTGYCPTVQTEQTQVQRDSQRVDTQIRNVVPLSTTLRLPSQYPNQPATEKRVLFN